MILAATVAVAGVGLLAFNLPRHGTPPQQLTGGQAGTSQPPTNPEIIREAAARTQAINWITQQVSRAAVISCDPQVCQELLSKDPSANVMTLGTGANDPLGSTLVVATAAVRAQFGSRLETVYAPAVIASFGSGNARIDILWVYPGGTVKYRSDLQTGLSARKSAEAQLLTNSQIGFSPTARAQLLGGGIDPQLPQLLALMAGIHPVDVVDFVNQSPGGGPASLVRAVDLAMVDSAAHMTRAAYLGWINGFIASQRSQYLPVWVKQVKLAAGQVVLRIIYGAPSPLS